MYEAYGKDLKTSRKNAGFTQLQVAVRTGYAIETIQKYERGTSKPSEEFVSKAKVLYKDQSLGTKFLVKISLIGQEEMKNLVALSGFFNQIVENAPQIQNTLEAIIQCMT